MRSDWLFPICTGAERLKDDNGDKLHPTQKPEALLARIMLASTKPGDIVLDPFFGSERPAPWPDASAAISSASSANRSTSTLRHERIAAVKPMADSDLEMMTGKRAEPRVAFVSLIDTGVMKPGTILYDAKRRWAARVRADGTLAIGDRAGSIHRIGAEVQGLGACNGWTFWHYERNGGLTEIDELRRIARLSMERAGS